MNGIFLADHHPIKTAIPDVNAICKPVLAQFGIDFFLRARVFDDDRLCALDTHELWQKHVYENMLFAGPLKIPLDSSLKNYHYLLEGNYLDKIVTLMKQFSIHNVIELVEVHESYTDVYRFGSSQPTTRILDFYLNNFDFLQKFICYFNDKSEKLWQLVTANAVKVDYYIKAPAMSDQLAKVITKPNIDFKKEISVSGLLGKVNFSQREIECLKFLIAGRTVKTISKLLNLSPRTIETHVNNIKAKLGYRNKERVIDFFNHHPDLLKIFGK